MCQQKVKTMGIKSKETYASPIERAKIRIDLNRQGLFVDDELHYLTSYGYFLIKRIAWTGNFTTDFKITKKNSPLLKLYGNRHPVKFILLDEV